MPRGEMYLLPWKSMSSTVSCDLKSWPTVGLQGLWERQQLNLVNPLLILLELTS